MSKFNLGSSLWVNKKEKTFLGKGRVELLKLIHETGSLSKASKIMKMSYKAAWDSLDIMNKASGTPLVESSSGGKGGGRSTLTPMAHLYIQLYDKIYNEQKEFFFSIENHMSDYETLMHFLTRKSLRLSGRNQIEGKIDKITISNLNAIIKLNINNEIFDVLITARSVDELGLKQNDTAYIVIKSSLIEIVKEINISKHKTNIFEATIKKIEKQKDNFEYTVETANKTQLILSITSALTSFKRGEKINIYINPKNIIIGI